MVISWLRREVWKQSAHENKHGNPRMQSFGSMAGRKLAPLVGSDYGEFNVVDVPTWCFCVCGPVIAAQGVKLDIRSRSKRRGGSVQIREARSVGRIVARGACRIGAVLRFVRFEGIQV